MNEIGFLALNKCLTSRPITVAFWTFCGERVQSERALVYSIVHKSHWSLLSATSERIGITWIHDLTGAIHQQAAFAVENSFSVWSDEAEIALSREGVMATAQTSPFCPPSVNRSLDSQARSTLRHRSWAAFTALLHWFGVFLNAAVGGELEVCLY